MTGKRQSKKCLNGGTQDPDGDAVTKTVLRPTVQAAVTVKEYSSRFGNLDPLKLIDALQFTRKT